MNGSVSRGDAVLPESAGNVDADMAKRLQFLQSTIAVLLVLLLAGVGYWQLVRSAEYKALDRRQSLRRMMLPAPRGVIYDRKHRVLVGNRVRTDVGLNLGTLRHEFEREKEIHRAAAASRDVPTVLPSSTEVARQARVAVVQRHLDRINRVLVEKVQLDAPELEQHFRRGVKAAFILVEDLSPAESSLLAQSLTPSGPVQLHRSTLRTYPYRNAAAHALGRVRRELVRTPRGKEFPILNYWDNVGNFGIEKQYDTLLQGTPGNAIIRVDAFGGPIDPPLERHEPTPGQDVVLSLDIDLQLAAERAMKATNGISRGAAVALKVETGEVLVLASKPDFDLNTVAPELPFATQALIDAAAAWLNRATQGVYPPGSSFKIFTTIAGLRGGTLQPDDVFHCTGSYDVGGHRFRCHNPNGHGSLALREALAHSCNVAAYKIGLSAGPAALAAEARRFHLGEPTGIDLPFETHRMLVPDPAWKQSERRGSWTPGDTINLSIGQGFLRYSPLQAACAIASLARRETLTIPTLLFQPARRASGERAPEPLGLTDQQYEAVIAGLRAVVATGIGREAQVPGISIAGKSGTAQVVREQGMTNTAWFIAFAPIERPEIAVAVALEGDQPGVEFAGAEHAAPIVREIIGTYFDPDPK